MAKTTLASNGFRAFLLTQFLGAFNDNAFKLVVSLLIVNLIVDPAAQSTYVALAGGLFTLPFILFYMYAGYLADRYSKKQMMIWVKIAEVGVMALGGLAFWLRQPGLMIAVVFLMGAQSTFFSPAKYGILPEILPDEQLSKGNGRVQMWTFLAIILGTATGGQILDIFKGSVHFSSIIFVLIAIAGVGTSFFITSVPAGRTQRRFEPLFLRDVWQTLRVVRSHRPLFLCVLGNAYFWFLAALFQMNILLYAKQLMGLGNAETGYLLASIALGIGLGSLLAGRWSGDKIEFGLVPLGAIGLGTLSICLSMTSGSYLLTMVLVFLLGISAALYSIPLNAYIQQQSPRDSRGRVLAASGFLTNIGIVLAAAVFWGLQDRLGLNPALTFLATGLGSFIVVGYICWLLPDFLLRFMAWLLTHTLYRITIVGKENVPKEGGALFVCNHVSYVDALIVQACIQRFIRFVMARQFYEAPFIRPVSRLMRAIPISTSDGPKELLKSLSEAAEGVSNGEFVCIFAEGAVTRTGNMLPFNRGLERIMRKTNAPIIPMYLDRVWGSIFSFEGGKVLRKLPIRMPYPVTVSFGQALPSDTSVFKVRSRIQELGAEAYGCRKDKQQLLSTRFFRQARRSPFRQCMADSTGISLKYWQALTGAMALSLALRRHCGSSENIGIFLPNSVAAALTNTAVTILGRCPVNLNYTTSQEALEAAIRKCELKQIFTSERFLKRLKIPARDNMIFMEEFRDKVTMWHKLFSVLAFFLLPHRLLRCIFRIDRKRHVDSVATIIFSSGSTGDPKGVMLSHANINSNIEGIFQAFRMDRHEIVLGILPFFHSFGFTGTLWLPLTTGMSIVYHPDPLDFKTVGALAQSHQATILTATPTFLLGYIRRCTPEQFASLRYVVVGAEKLRERVRNAFVDKFGLEPLEGYGCTELSPIAAVNVPDVNREDLNQVGAKPGTIGHPLPNVAVKIVDPETFEEQPPDTEGLMLIKGPNVMLSYLNDPQETAHVMRDDWYVTGDLASVDPDGFITITDRLSRFSKIGGEMVPHVRIEEEIHAALGVDCEQVCAVTSVADERKGEALVVLCTRQMDVEVLRRKLSESGLPNLWIPRADMFFNVSEIPVLGSGKLDLKRIKAIAAERCEGQE